LEEDVDAPDVHDLDLPSVGPSLVLRTRPEYSAPMTCAYASSRAHCIDPCVQTFGSLGGSCDTISLIFAGILLEVKKKKEKKSNEACKIYM
jgi:hypothetical protein